MDNAPAHPTDIDLKNITVNFFPSNTTSRIERMDQGVIRNFKAYYRRQLVQRIIINCHHAHSADDVLHYREAGILIPTGTLIDEDVVVQEAKCMVELDKVLKHLTVGGETISADDFVSVDDNVPVCNEWNDDYEKILSVEYTSTEDTFQEEQLTADISPLLSESLNMIRRLHLLSTNQYPESHPFILHLQSKLRDVFLDKKVSKQRSIHEFFKSL
ncbi:unnamed protein product [Adineta ricciae]|uniref:DDE-1 domain-containing protein n=1 Tax=Adineta ricciae TaxID=249248 RepID=A0A815GZB8_ADIRI|nr:unnamed protein product [Adineta ricciae]CAF1458519.1 unnamed protein product [Adineta ricciae]